MNPLLCMTHFWVFRLINWQLVKVLRRILLSKDPKNSPRFAQALWSVQYHKLWVE